MTEAFAFTETDRTKSKWVARVYHDFVMETGRSRTTLRGLFYFALQRAVSDYPICGGFVGEIRITRPYHENDGEKLAKWMKKARTLGYIPADAILEDKPGEHVFLPKASSFGPQCIEVWLNKSATSPLLHPVCEKHAVALVFVNGRASQEAISDLLQRCSSPTTILCLSDLSQENAFFAQDLEEDIEKSRLRANGVKIRVKSIGLSPEQILELKIPMIRANSKTKENKEYFKKYLKSFALDPKNMGEIDALEVYYPGGIATFLDKVLSGFAHNHNQDIETQDLETNLDKKHDG